eukprot:scaffold50558_cov30-Tisochrysis_lutea.AAC.5
MWAARAARGARWPQRAESHPRAWRCPGSEEGAGRRRALRLRAELGASQDARTRDETVRRSSLAARRHTAPRTRRGERHTYGRPPPSTGWRVKTPSERHCSLMQVARVYKKGTDGLAM